MTVMQDALKILVKKGKFAMPVDGVFTLTMKGFLHSSEIELLKSQLKFQSFEIWSLANNEFSFRMIWNK